MIRSILHFAVFGYLLAAAPAFAFACSWEEARKSTVYIFVDATDPVTGAKTAAQGTGFVISRLGYVLTASHLLRDWVKQRELDKAQNPIKASIGAKPGYMYSSPLDVQVVNPGNSAAEDVALLKLPPLEFGSGVSSGSHLHGFAPRAKIRGRDLGTWLPFEPECPIGERVSWDRNRAGRPLGCRQRL